MNALSPAEREHAPTADQIAVRRRASKIPEAARYAPKWRLALDMLDELATCGHAPPVLVADAGYGQVAAFRTALTARHIPYVVATTATTTAHPAGAAPEPVAYAGTGRRPTPRYPEAARTLKALATTPPPDATDADTDAAVTATAVGARQTRWREATRSTPDKRVWMSGWFTAIRVRPAGRGLTPEADGTYPEGWLLTQWAGPNATEPSDYWLSTLPPDTPIADLVRLAKARWRIEHDYRELKTALGLDHFEGRSWAGWHTATSPSSPPPTSSSPPGASPGTTREKTWGRAEPDHLRRRPRTAVPPGDLARLLPHLPPNRPTLNNLTKHY